VKTALENGDLKKARELHFKILEAVKVQSRVYWPLSGKIILQELGLPFKLVTRVEEQPYTEEDVEAIRVYHRELLGL